MLRLLQSLALLCAFAVPALAHADTFTFTATGSGGGYSGSGVLTVTNNNNGTYTITNVTGQNITGILGPNTFFGNDNLFTPNGASLFDSKGFSFTANMTNTNFNVNIYSTGAGAYAARVLDSDGSPSSFPVTLAVQNTTTPEPSSLILLGTGMLAAVGAARRRLNV